MTTKTVGPFKAQAAQYRDIGFNPVPIRPGTKSPAPSRWQTGRQEDETFRNWLDRVGGAKAVAAELKDLDNFPTPDEAPEFYVDYGETGPYVAEVGESECAT